MTVLAVVDVFVYRRLLVAVVSAEVRVDDWPGVLPLLPALGRPRPRSRARGGDIPRRPWECPTGQSARCPPACSRRADQRSSAPNEKRRRATSV